MGSMLYQVIEKLNWLKGVLRKLNRERFSEVKRRAEKAKENLWKFQDKL